MYIDLKTFLESLGARERSRSEQARDWDRDRDRDREKRFMYSMMLQRARGA